MKTSSPFPEIFAAVGLTDDASKIYLLLLEHVGLPAGRIAQLSTFKRGYTYNLLHELVEQGFAHESQEKGVKRYRAASPLVIKGKLENKVDQFANLLNKSSEIIPLLLQRAQRSSSVPRIQLFRGSEGVKSVYEDTLNCQSGKIYAVADFATTFPQKKSDELHKWMWRYSSRRADKDIWYYGLVNRSPESDQAYEKRKAQKRKMKMLVNVPISVEINIYDDKVAICSTAEEMMGVIIQSTEIAESAKLLHQALWAVMGSYRV
jgi:sugar-specific transcriptional regulator TrmB